MVQWSDDPARCVENALSPARVTSVLVDEENNYATVIVPDEELSNAIGKRGQNARLAARLTGMHIDIKNEELAARVVADLRAAGGLAEDLIGEDEEQEHRCEYVAPNGVRCRNMARPGSAYCGIHEQMAAVDAAEVSDDPDSLV